MNLITLISFKKLKPLAVFIFTFIWIAAISGHEDQMQYKSAGTKVPYSSIFHAHTIELSPDHSTERSPVISDKTNYIAALQKFYEKELLLQNRDDITVVELRQRNIAIVTVVVLFILSVAVAGGLYKQRKVQQNINKLLLEKNEQIQMQSEEILVQAEEVNKLNEDLESLNQNLENKIRSRTRMLRDQNNLLAEYAYSNAHELRAPVASVMGLVDLLNRSRLTSDEREIVEHLAKSVNELALVVKDIRIKLERNDILFFDDKDIEW